MPMSLDYANLVQLFRSPIGPEAKSVFLQEASTLGLGPYVRDAFVRLEQRAIVPNARPHDAITEVRDAFSPIDSWLALSRQHAGAIRSFSTYTNAVAELTAKAQKASAYGRALLSERDARGKKLITSEMVRNHISFVTSIAEGMGTQHLHDPQSWEAIIDAGHEDLREMRRNLLLILSSEDIATTSLQLLREANRTIMLSRKDADVERRRRLDDLGFRINQAYAHRDFDELFQMILEVWVHAVMILQPYKDADELVPPASRMRIIQPDQDAKSADDTTHGDALQKLRTPHRPDIAHRNNVVSHAKMGMRTFAHAAYMPSFTSTIVTGPMQLFRTLGKP